MSFGSFVLWWYVYYVVKLAHMQFLAARSRCTNFCSARYSIPFAICRHMLISLFVMSDTCTNIVDTHDRCLVADNIMLCKQIYNHWHCLYLSSFEKWAQGIIITVGMSIERHATDWLPCTIISLHTPPIGNENPGMWPHPCHKNIDMYISYVFICSIWRHQLSSVFLQVG